MKFYSEKTKQLYETEDELVKAESSFDDAEKAKEDAKEEIVALANEIATKKDDLSKKLSDFFEHYGSLKLDSEDNKNVKRALSKGVFLDDSLFYPFRFFNNFD